MSRPTFLLLGFLATATACSGADPGEREPLVPVEYHEDGFSVGRVSYTGVCEETAYEQCRSESDNCLSNRCGGLSGALFTQCAEICSSYDCSGKSDTCLDYEAEFDFGPADTTLTRACWAWEAALNSGCIIAPQTGRCRRIATTWKPEFASVLECSAQQALGGICSSCVLPGSTFGEDLCLEAGFDVPSCTLRANGNLLGAVLRDDVIEAAYTCLTYEDTPTVNDCLNAWEEGVLP